MITVALSLPLLENETSNIINFFLNFLCQRGKSGQNEPVIKRAAESGPAYHSLSITQRDMHNEHEPFAESQYEKIFFDLI